jgi:hypothetical protein
MGARVTIVARNGETGGALGVVGYRMPPHYAGPPAHIHADFDEVFMVHEGSLTFPSAMSGAGPGDTVVVPGSVPHTFANLAADAAWFTIIFAPGGFESYFDRVPMLIVDGKPDIEAIGKLSDSYGVTTVGPPLGADRGGAG